jgi:hypothetical protein
MKKHWEYCLRYKQICLLFGHNENSKNFPAETVKNILDSPGYVHDVKMIIEAATTFGPFDSVTGLPKSQIANLDIRNIGVSKMISER